MFLIVGRVPHGENAIFYSDAKTFAQAKRQFVDGLWGDEHEDRKRAREAEGVDHYIEAAFELDGRYRILEHPQYGAQAARLWWPRSDTRPGFM